MTRALRAAILGVALFSPVALSACSAGQVTQTATQDRDKVGAMAQVGDITLRQIELAYPQGGRYDAGDDAELTLAIVNTGEEPDTLVAVDGEGFSSAEITGSTAEVDEAGTPVGGASVTTASDEIEIAPDTTVFVGSGDLAVTLTDLDEDLTPSQSVTVVLTFERAGEIEVPATVANPSRAQERGEGFDFHQEEGGGESVEGPEDTARERESAEN